MSALVLGDFNAEMLWRDPDLCMLPAVGDPQAKRIVDAMDELLFPMCGPNDLLVTRGELDPHHQTYLEELGFRFAHLSVGSTDNRLANLTEVLFSNQWVRNWELRPFAWTPDIVELGKQSGIVYEGPLSDVVRKVNSKVYSTRLRDRMGLKNPALIIDHAAELVQAGTTIMNDSNQIRDILIKDPFGVSGSGNLTVSSPTMIERLARYLARQERRGKRTLLLVEPLFDRHYDFSCQLNISRYGERTVLSIQEMANEVRAYAGSRTASNAFVETLEAKGYFHIADEVARLLYKDGYWGPVCIDSMVLADGTIFPVVEINARMSMGALNHLLEERLPSEARFSWLSYMSLLLSIPLSTARLLDALDDANLLYRDPERGGILPLASGPLSVNAEASAKGEHYKARLYFKLIDGANVSPDEHLVLLRDILAGFCAKLPQNRSECNPSN